MKDTARILTTLRCSRKCSYCANKQGLVGVRPLSWDRLPIQLDSYSKVCLTGGEPLLEMGRLRKLIPQLRQLGRMQVYLYAADYGCLDDFLWAVDNTDGITWTIHEKPRHFDAARFKLVQHYIDYNKHNRLVLNTKAQALWGGMVEYEHWERVTIMFMGNTTCQLPLNEDLYVLEEATND